MCVCVDVCVDVCGCMWMYVDACGCMWMYVDACGYVWMYVDVWGCTWFLLASMGVKLHITFHGVKYHLRNTKIMTQRCSSKRLDLLLFLSRRLDIAF